MAKDLVSNEVTDDLSADLQPETVFADFYCKVISKLYNLKCRQILNDVQMAIKDMRMLKNREIETPKRLFFSYKFPAARCAYIFAYSVLHSTMVYFEFLEFLRRNRSRFKPILDIETLTLCCLGGGPGIDAVAICKAINDFISENIGKNDQLVLDVYITVVDRVPNWKKDATAIMNEANEVSHLLDSKKINLHVDFIKADLMKPFENGLKEKIKESDFVSVVKFGSAVTDVILKDCNPELQNMMQNVIKCMPDGSSLFSLDASGGNVFYSMVNVFQSDPMYFRPQNSKHKEYRLEDKTVNKIRSLMMLVKSTQHRTILPTRIGKISSCMWIKIIPAKEEIKISRKKLKNVNAENAQSSPSKGQKKKKKNCLIIENVNVENDEKRSTASKPRKNKSKSSTIENLNKN